MKQYYFISIKYYCYPVLGNYFITTSFNDWLMITTILWGCNEDITQIRWGYHRGVRGINGIYIYIYCQEDNALGRTEIDMKNKWFSQDLIYKLWLLLMAVGYLFVKPPNSKRLGSIG